jgi:hypothetical protein
MCIDTGYGNGYPLRGASYPGTRHEGGNITLMGVLVYGCDTGAFLAADVAIDTRRRGYIFYRGKSSFVFLILQRSISAI